MKETLVANRYAQAFVDTYSDPSVQEKVSMEISSFADLWSESLDFRNVMLNPAFPAKVKKETLTAIIDTVGLQGETRKVIFLINENGRMGLLPVIAEEFKKLSFEARGKVKVEVTSATKLSTEEVNELATKMTAIAGKEAVVETTVDPSLIGGLIARVGSKVYDGSVKNQLAALKVQI